MADKSHNQGANPAADVIRQKLASLYDKEPSAREELAEAKESTHRSRHQQFMLDLSKSGRSLAEIQTAWHNYYQALPDEEKHKVWQEFYQEHNKRQKQTHPQPQHTVQHPPAHSHRTSMISKHSGGTKSVAALKKQLLNKVQAQASTRKKPSHLKSLLFGLACGSIVLVVFLFGFFNERFIAPFITPSKSVSNTPIIIDPADTVAGSEPKLIIPKINVELPVVYDEPSVNEAAVQKALERGVLHYATTSQPGEKGNGAIFGHSSNNIFNPGKYKFAFVLLKQLEPGDLFYVQKGGKRYAYKVFDKKIVKPEEIGVLSPVPGHPATFTLITCDPPGSSANRLVVVADQISPDPTKNIASSAKTEQAAPEILPSNSQTLWNRFWRWMSS